MTRRNRDFMILSTFYALFLSFIAVSAQRVPVQVRLYLFYIQSLLYSFTFLRVSLEHTISSTVIVLLVQQLAATFEVNRDNNVVVVVTPLTDSFVQLVWL